MGRLCAYRVSAADPRRVVVTVRCGSARVIKAHDAHEPYDGGGGGAADGGVGPGRALQPVQCAEVPLAQLWRLMPRGQRGVECLLEVRLRRAAGDTRPEQPATVVLQVDVTQEAWPASM